MLFQIDTKHLDTRSRKIVNAVIEAADSKEASSAFGVHSTAATLTRLPGVVQFYIWKLVKKLIQLWSIDYDYDQYDPQYRAVYVWAKEKNDE